MMMSRFVACAALLLFLPVCAQELPTPTALEVRLSAATGSRISHRGDPIQAIIIAPVSVQGRILVPQGSRLLGYVANATALGLGLKHSTATIAYAFHTLHLLSGESIPVKTKLVEVLTAKEHVDALGTVRGIHPIVSLSSGLAFYTVPLSLINPAIGIPVSGMKSLIAPSASAEINFPAGTELILLLTTAVTVPAPNADDAPVKALLPDDRTDLGRLLNSSAQCAYLGSRPSDVVNVLVIGSRDQIDRAFHASGWSQAQRKSPMSLYRMYHALTKRHGYPKAPMNTLTLNGVPSAFVHQKSLDTVEKRHHVRFWQYPGREDVWLGAAAEDVGFRFKLTHWTHATDPNIDTERAKVINDLAFTGCVTAVGLLPRGSKEPVQGPGAEHSQTDGDVAVIRLNECVHPNLMAGVGDKVSLRKRAPIARALSAVGDDLIRSNIAFTTYNTLRLFARHKVKTTASAPRIQGDPRGLDWLPRGVSADSLAAETAANRSAGTRTTVSGDRVD